MYVADTLSRAYNTETKRDIASDVNKKDDSEERMYSENKMLPEQKLIELQHELEKATKTSREY